MPAAVVGGNLRYPTLQAIANLFRAQINDDFQGATNTPGEGLIAYNTAPFLLTIMDSAIRELYSDLRNVGDPSLILDNYILTGLPALTAPNPDLQVCLSYAGFFDGFQWHPQWYLPISCNKVERVWERWTGSEQGFTDMSPAPFGLPPAYQVNRMGQWEMRQNALWMPGSLNQTDIRLRCRITFPDFLDPVSINFSTAYVPIVDSQNAIVAKMLILYAKRYAPEQYPLAVQDESRLLDKLKLEVVRNMQLTEYQRATYGNDATASFSWTWTNL